MREICIEADQENPLDGDDDDVNDDELDDILNEARILKDLTHPCILQMHEVFECPDSDTLHWNLCEVAI